MIFYKTNKIKINKSIEKILKTCYNITRKNMWQKQRYNFDACQDYIF